MMVKDSGKVKFLMEVGFHATQAIGRVEVDMRADKTCWTVLAETGGGGGRIGS